MRVRRPVVLAFAIALAGLAARLAPAQQTAATLRGTYEVEFELQYLLHVPDHEPGARLPLILFLHGAGERGDDLAKVKVHGPPKLVEKDPEFPFIVVSPQCPADQWWTLPPLLKLLDHVCATQPVDEDRIYLTGLSMGGFGSFSLAALAPERFAAVAPICGGGDPGTAAQMKHLPFWVFHGKKDPVVPVARSTQMVDALKAAGAEVRYTEYPEAGHDAWSATYDDPELYRWFLEYERHREEGKRRP